MMIWLIRLPPSLFLKQQRESYCSGLLGAGNYFSASHISGECPTTNLLSSSCVILLLGVDWACKSNIVWARKTLNMYLFMRTFTWNIADLCSCFMSYMFYTGNLFSCASGLWDIGQALDLCSFCLTVIKPEISSWRCEAFQK